MSSMHLRVLGPLEAVADEGTNIPLGGPKQRAVLGLLAAGEPHAIETDRLIEELWPDSVSEANRKTVQAYVARLRAAGLADAIQSGPSGYRLDIDIVTIDAGEFEDALTRARERLAVRPGETADLLWDALRLWRGRPFEDAFQAAALELEVARLEALRVVAYEAWAEASLAAGRHREILPDLRRIAEDYPLLEGLWASLIVAEYRSGRQAEATASYAAVTRRLWDEVGVEPGSELADLHRRMLNQDPTLDPPPGAPRLVVPARGLSEVPR